MIHNPVERKRGTGVPPLNHAQDARATLGLFLGRLLDLAQLGDHVAKPNG